MSSPRQLLALLTQQHLLTCNHRCRNLPRPNDSKQSIKNVKLPQAVEMLLIQRKIPTKIHPNLTTATALCLPFNSLKPKKRWLKMKAARFQTIRDESESSPRDRPSWQTQLPMTPCPQMLPLVLPRTPPTTSSVMRINSI